MGESLFYSWLRHVKECQIVQTNWTTSGQWPLLHEDKLEEIKSVTDKFFSEKYGYDIYKKTASLSQLLRQAECDALGVAMQDGANKIYAVDVAFHEEGLNYGDRETTIKKIVMKCLRTAMCIYGYLDAREAEIIFASPKITRSILDGVLPCMAELQKIMDDLCFHFRFRILANDDFRDKVLDPILTVSGGVSDTNELFIRCYHMVQMFEQKDRLRESPPRKAASAPKPFTADTEDTYAELEIGKVAQLVLKPILELGNVPEAEIERLQDKEYSKKALDLSFPLLVRQDAQYDKLRYYKDPVNIKGKTYMMCSQWVERPDNNARPYLMKWIRDHQ
jgi:hypothetical protein